MSATRLWSPVTRPAPFWLKPLPRNACSPVADGAALGTCVRLPTTATAAGRWLPSRGRCPHRSRPRRLGLCGDRSPALAWAAHGLCPVPWKAAPWTCEAPHGAEHVPVHQLWVWVFQSPRSHPQLVYDEPGIRRIVQNTGALRALLTALARAYAGTWRLPCTTASTSGPSGVYARYKLAASPHEGHERTISPRTRTPWPHAPSLPRAGPAGPRDARAERSRTSEFTESTGVTEAPRKIILFPFSQ